MSPRQCLRKQKSPSQSSTHFFLIFKYRWDLVTLMLPRSGARWISSVFPECHARQYFILTSLFINSLHSHVHKQIIDRRSKQYAGLKYFLLIHALNSIYTSVANKILKKHYGPVPKHSKVQSLFRDVLSSKQECCLYSTESSKGNVIWQRPHKFLPVTKPRTESKSAAFRCKDLNLSPPFTPLSTTASQRARYVRQPQLTTDTGFQIPEHKKQIKIISHLSPHHQIDNLTTVLSLGLDYTSDLFPRQILYFIFAVCKLLWTVLWSFLSVLHNKFM